MEERMKALNCITCGEPREYAKRGGPGRYVYHANKECAEGVVQHIWNEFSKGRNPDECWIWEGSTYLGKGMTAPAPRTQVTYDGQTRVVPLRAVATGRPRVMFRVTCGDSLCLNPNHLQARTKNQSGRRGRKALLPVAPLLPWVESFRAQREERPRRIWGESTIPPHMPHDTGWLYDKIKEAEKKGTIDVISVDRICIDYLNKHPAQIYGWLFFSAGEETDGAA